VGVLELGLEVSVLIERYYHGKEGMKRARRGERGIMIGVHGERVSPVQVILTNG
jgi:hypothetical protein